MSDIVFILGAGASRQAGGPLVSDFMTQARRLFRDGDIPAPPGKPDPKESFNLVLKATDCLQFAHSKSGLDLHNVEWVFSAFQMAETLGRLPDPDIPVTGLPDAMVDVIVNTIEQTVEFPVDKGHLVPPEPYGDFALLVSHLVREARKSVAVLTFNYDVAVDWALTIKRPGITYALGEPSHGDATPLLKLHGSLNWAWIPKCSVEKVLKVG